MDTEGQHDCGDKMKEDEMVGGNNFEEMRNAFEVTSRNP
jgi:hypothetical protein